MSETQRPIVEGIIAGDKGAFEEAFHLYYNPLFNLARALLKDHAVAEEQVQEVFVKLWEKGKLLNPELKLLPYLLTSVRNRCYNYIRDQKVFEKHLSEQQRYYQDQILDYDLEDINEELINKIHEAIALLPSRCKEVFHLSRFSGLSHKQISERLGISAKTVENHITKAMKIIKNEFQDAALILLILGGFLNFSVFI